MASPPVSGKDCFFVAELMHLDALFGMLYSPGTNKAAHFFWVLMNSATLRLLNGQNLEDATLILSSRVRNIQPFSWVLLFLHPKP